MNYQSQKNDFDLFYSKTIDDFIYLWFFFLILLVATQKIDKNVIKKLLLEWQRELTETRNLIAGFHLVTCD